MAKRVSNRALRRAADELEMMQDAAVGLRQPDNWHSDMRQVVELLRRTADRRNQVKRASKASKVAMRRQLQLDIDGARNEA